MSVGCVGSFVLPVRRLGSIAPLAHRFRIAIGPASSRRIAEVDLEDAITASGVGRYREIARNGLFGRFPDLLPAIVIGDRDDERGDPDEIMGHLRGVPFFLLIEAPDAAGIEAAKHEDRQYRSRDIVGAAALLRYACYLVRIQANVREH